VDRQDERLTEGRTIRTARSYDLGTEAMYLGRGPRYRQRLLDLAELKAGERFLDIGCGPGRLVLAARERVGKSGEAYGIDPSAEMVELATRKAAKAGLSARFVRAAAEKLPFDDGFFDVITSSLVVHHITGDEPKRKAFGEMRRALKVGGRLLIVDFSIPRTGPLSLIGKPLGKHMNETSIDDYPELMRTAGLAPVGEGEAALKVFRYVLGTVAQNGD
jgi:ubiquinone/menaquinone biosynthesis C-methylase UbiE